MSTMSTDLSSAKVVVIGTGVFGISTTLAMAKKFPQSQITTIDRYEPPVKDATSVDTTRCLRTDYRDPMYGKLAAESMRLVKEDPQLSQFFFQCGMTVVYDGKPRTEKMWTSEKATATAIVGEEMIEEYQGAESVYKSIHGVDAEQDFPGETEWNLGYKNKENGFIDAEKSIKALYERAKTYDNVKFIFNPVEEIVYEGNKSKGVMLEDGRFIEADIVVVAAGAWTTKLVDITHFSNQFCGEVCWFEVSPEETAQLRANNMAITTNIATGINLFPPHEGFIKVLQRSPGYINTIVVKNPDPKAAVAEPTIKISHPRTILTNPGDWIPEEAEKGIRAQLKEIMPMLADRPFARTKLCWYSQTKGGNFLIDHHPEYKNVILATCGSGHAWKFVPVLGDKVIERIQGTLDAEMAEKWSWAEKLVEPEESENTPRLPGVKKEMKDILRMNPLM